MPALERWIGDLRAFGRVAQRLASFDPLDVDDVGAGGDADLDGLAESVAQLDEQREPAVADRRALGRQPAVLDEAEAEAVCAVGGAVEQPSLGQHGARPMGRALGDADAAGEVAHAELGSLGEGVDDVEGDPHRLQLRPSFVHCRIGGRRWTHGTAASSCAPTRTSTSSRPWAATSWTPRGRPSSGQPSGSDNAG